MNGITATADGVILTLRIVPRAARNGIQGVHGEALKIRLQAPPVDGKANAALIRYLADTLEVPPGAIELLSGATGRAKRVRVRGLTAATTQARLGLPA